MGKNTHPGLPICRGLIWILLLAALPPAPLRAGGGPARDKAPKTMAAHDVTDVAARPIPAIEQPGRAALAMIDFPWQSLGYRIFFLGSRPGYRAMTLTDRQRIEVYVKAGELPRMLAFDIAHEIGHVVDLRYNDTGRRRQWLKLRGIAPGTPWFGCSACSDYTTPAGDFAETFAYLLLGPGSYHSQMAPPPPADQVRELARFCHIEHPAAASETPQAGATK